MNPSGVQQTLGNICVAFAAILYAIPLQKLLREFARKKDNGGGVLAALIIMGPMWLLLTIALLCVTTSGGLNSIRLNRTLIHVLTVFTAIAMVVISLLRFEFANNSSLAGKLIGNLPIHVFPIVTILFVVVNLNPRIATVVPAQIVNVPWIALAALNIVACGGFLAYKLVATGASQVAGVGYMLGRGGQVTQTNLARVSTLDPVRDFEDLLGLAGEYQDRTVRDAALARLRSNPEFVNRLAAELTNGTPSSGAAEHALAAVDVGTYSNDEVKVLALPALSAMERVTSYARSEFRYMTKERRRGTRKESGRLFKAVAAKLSGSGVDFAQPIHELERTFANSG